MDNEYLKVKDKDNLIRDPFSNGILNVDQKGYDNYIHNYKKVYNESKKIKDLENGVNAIKKDLDEIKDLLKGLLK